MIHCTSEADLVLADVHFLCSTGIKTVVEKENLEGLSAGDKLLCTACQMTVIWIQNQLREKETKDRVLNYVNEVTYFET